MNRLFEKCRGWPMPLVAYTTGKGLYPYYFPLRGESPTEVVIEGEPKVMLGSNNYLGFTHHPKVLEASRSALREYGAGATGSRMLTGNTPLHEALEERFAHLWGKEAALVFTTGYQTNLGTISTLVGRSDHVFLDRQAHSSALEGARLGYGKVHRYPHQNPEALARMLSEAPEEAGKMVVTDGIFSMEGNLLELPSLLEVVDRHGAALLLDDAHALGVLGEKGAGTASHFGVLDRVPLLMATFSKSLASVGGVVAGPAEVIGYLKHSARSLLFSAGMPPGSVAGVLEAFDLMTSEPEHRERLWDNTRAIQNGLDSLGFELGDGRTPVIPVYVRDEKLSFRLWRGLFDRGVFVLPVIPPAVAHDATLLRVSVSAAHTADQIDRVLTAFREAGREAGLI